MAAARPLPPSADIGPGGQSVGQAAQFCLAALTAAGSAQQGGIAFIDDPAHHAKGKIPNRLMDALEVYSVFRKQRALPAIRALNEASHPIPRIWHGNHIARIKSSGAFLHSQGQTQTSSLGAARPLPPSADIGPGGQSASSTAYLIGGEYWMPPLLQSEFSPRGIFSFDSAPTLRS